MISIMFLAVLLDRPAIALRNVALSALLILFVYPESLIDVGFQMSFAAVTALVAVYEILRERDRQRAAAQGADQSLIWRGLLFFGGILLSTLIAGIAVAPFAAYHFHKSQQFAMIANLIAIPICNILVMPAALAALVAMPLGLESWPLRAMGIGIEAMNWCAYTVSALPGAVGRIPEFPTFAFALMLAGGLWVCLWRRPWRYAGLFAIFAGLVVAPFRAAPDVYVGRDGLVAVRMANGLLTALSPRGSSFDLARILEHDGDGRRPDDVGSGQGFRCDWEGCVISAKGRTIAVARTVSALADDCEKATVVIALRSPGGPVDGGRCPASRVVDGDALRRHGAHTIRFGAGGLAEMPEAQVAHVAMMRGVRPWSRKTEATHSERVETVWTSAGARANHRRSPAPESSKQSGSEPARASETTQDPAITAPALRAGRPPSVAAPGDARRPALEDEP